MNVAGPLKLELIAPLRTKQITVPIDLTDITLAGGANAAVNVGAGRRGGGGLILPAGGAIEVIQGN